jgi:hypothetical protein
MQVSSADAGSASADAGSASAESLLAAVVAGIGG